MDQTVTRRSFVGAITAASASRIVGANDRIRLGVIGSGGRGRYLPNDHDDPVQRAHGRAPR